MKKMYGLAAGCVCLTCFLTACAPQTGASIPNVIRVENEDVNQNWKITVNSSETVKVEPDMAQITYGVRSEDSDPSRCQQKNTEAVNKVVAYLKEQGFEDSSIKTEGFSLDPQYDWSSNTQKIVGYQMNTQITVTDVPMEKVGALLSRVLEQGANEIWNVNYFASDYDQAYEDALKKAVESAKKKAEALASASGKTVGEVLNVEEYRDDQYGRYVSANVRSNAKYAAAAMTEDAVDMGVMAGTMEVTADITVEFELLP